MRFRVWGLGFRVWGLVEGSAPQVEGFRAARAIPAMMLLAFARALCAQRRVFAWVEPRGAGLVDAYHAQPRRVVGWRDGG